MRAFVLLGLTPFLAIGGWLSIKAISNWRLAAASAAWPKAEAVVSRSQTTSSTSRNSRDRTSSTMYSADLEFRYTVRGKQYATSTRHFGQTVGSGDSSEAKVLSLRYAPGTRVEVSYDPSNRSEVIETTVGFRLIEYRK